MRKFGCLVLEARGRDGFDFEVIENKNHVNLLSVGAILQHLHSEQIECSDWTDSCVLVDLAALAACTLPGYSGDLLVSAGIAMAAVACTKKYTWRWRRARNCGAKISATGVFLRYV